MAEIDATRMHTGFAHSFQEFAAAAADIENILAVRENGPVKFHAAANLFFKCREIVLAKRLVRSIVDDGACDGTATGVAGEGITDVADGVPERRRIRRSSLWIILSYDSRTRATSDPKRFWMSRFVRSSAPR